MNNLHLVLLAVGAVLLVALFAYNKWQEYRHRKLAEQVLNVRHSDVLLDGDGAQDVESEVPDLLAEPRRTPDLLEPLPICRHLVEPMLRRTQWLSSVVDELGLGNVTVHRGRAEELVGVVSAPWVTARAVARLDKLARWCVPLLDADGTLVAMKGRSAAEELAEDRRALERLGLVSAEVTAHGGDVLEEPVLTVDLRFRPRLAAQGASRTRRKGAGGGAGRKGAGGGRAGRARRPVSGRGSEDTGTSPSS